MRIIVPQELGRSLQRVSEKKILEELENKLFWYHGIKDTHVVGSQNEGNEFILIKTQKYILCYQDNNFIANIDEHELNVRTIKRFLEKSIELKLIEAQDSHLQLAKDLIMASNIKEKSWLLDILDSNKSSEIRLFPKKS